MCVCFLFLTKDRCFKHCCIVDFNDLIIHLGGLISKVCVFKLPKMPVSCEQNIQMINTWWIHLNSSTCRHDLNFNNHTACVQSKPCGPHALGDLGTSYIIVGGLIKYTGL